jgi:hypothetical protein
MQNRNVIRSSKAITYWQQHLDAQLSSGLKQSAYCREHNISDKYFSAWKAKLRKTPSKKTSDDVQLVPVSIKPSIAPTKLSADLPSDTVNTGAVIHSLKMNFPNGVSVDVSAPNELTFLSLMTHLAQLPC